jgi:hypothetical protein
MTHRMATATKLMPIRRATATTMTRMTTTATKHSNKPYGTQNSNNGNTKRYCNQKVNRNSDNETYDIQYGSSKNNDNNSNKTYDNLEHMTHRMATATKLMPIRRATATTMTSTATTAIDRANILILLSSSSEASK